MKKVLFGAFIVLGAILSTNAQVTILTQPFSAAGIPVGWTQSAPAIPGDGWIFNNTYGANMNNYIANQGYCAFVDDWDNNAGQITKNWDSLKSPVMNCAAYSHVYISLNFMFWVDDGNETGSIAVSTNGGASWITALPLPNTGGGWANGAIFDISAAAAGHASVMVAFTYYNGCTNPKTQYVAVGMCIQNVKIYAPAEYNVQVMSQNQSFLMQVGAPYTFSGAADNFGYDGITSMYMNYSVNHVAAAPQTISGIVGFDGLTAYNWSMPSVPFTPHAAGTYTVRFWASNLNSNPNVNTDTLVTTFFAVDSVQRRMVMFEETSNASCNPCMYAMPNIDSVCDNTVAYCNSIRYHWYFPGQDMMNLETATLVNDRFVTYYGQNGVPSGSLDGRVIPPSPYQGSPYFSSAWVQSEAAVGSPFKITITSLTYTAATKTYSLTATIKAYAAFPAGLKAQVALTEDSVDFKTDQSTEDPTNSFVFGGGSNPNSYYDYVINFPNVVEAMLPSDQGTSLAAFTSGSTQTIKVSWVKNHPWAAKYKSYPYDSSATQHLTVFVQDDAGNAIAGIPAKYVYQSARAGIASSALGVQEFSDNGVPFNMYPNPTNNNTTLAFNLTQDQNVDVELYNMLGEKVYADNEGLLSSGQHTISINGSTLPNGTYLVRLTTNGGITIQKLLIQK